MTDAYAELEERFKRISVLEETERMLQWDSATLMPAGGAEARGEQLAGLAGLAHELRTAPDLADLLAAAEGEAREPWRAANLREMRRLTTHATAVPQDLVVALNRAASTCEMVWREARPADDFAAVKPLLAEVLRLTRETAAAKAEALGLSPYDALMDSYEPGGRIAEIEPLFDDLAAFLPGFLDRAEARQAARPAPEAPEGPFPKAKQQALAHDLMRHVGFDFSHGRLDESLHPFCGGVPEDVRITTRYSEAEFVTALLGVLHETGHALYERGLPADWRRQPVGAARGMVIHESQSLLIEMQACRSRDFVAFLAPKLAQAFGGRGPAWEPENIYRLYTRIERGLIRVDADEVTYPAHVILRTRLERALLSGDLPLDELPQAFNDGLEGMLGVRPPNDRLGCLQDIHWYDGAFGYFPTYTLGAMAAAQFFAAAKAAHAEIPEALSRGDFGPLLAWLRPHVHEVASLLSTREILEKATGKPLDPEVFKAHLETRYLES